MSEIVIQFQQVAASILSLSGLFWIGITVTIYVFSKRIHTLTGNHPLTLPLVISALVLGGLLFVLDVPVSEFQRATSLIHWLLGPVTVALAVPLHHQYQRIAGLGWRLWVAIVAGGVIAPALAWFTLYLFNAPLMLSMTMLVKSITTPLAMETAALTGGVPAIAAVFVISTGVVGAMVCPWVFKLLGGNNPAAQGVALGTVAHAIGTAKALQLSELTGALAAISLSLNGVLTAFVLPVLISTLE
ncbi:LrgB family protein [Alteromonas ponticola]|uniref:LrgB family protein n=1 Tax=Alteromonas ponticola TaxID=2720613 RepID=A0ABX1QYP5_9ALTE|nr:LrgB family protein [Alteromonas ponticola]NMH59344.1 LrgB family protein [Alteromonas ponticola]